MESTVAERGQQRLLVCAQCDTLQRVVAPAAGGRFRCVCCNAPLGASWPGCEDRLLALVLSCALFLLLLQQYPLLQLMIKGQTVVAGMFEASQVLWSSGYQAVALLVFLTSLLAPTFFILVVGYLALALKLGMHLPFSALLLGALSKARSWAMLDVFLISLLVAVVKLGSMAELSLGIGFWGLLGLTLSFAALIARLDIPELWLRLEQIRR